MQAFHVEASQINQLRAWMLFYVDSMTWRSWISFSTKKEALETASATMALGIWPAFVEIKGTIWRLQSPGSASSWARSRHRQLRVSRGSKKTPGSACEMAAPWLAAVTGHHGDIPNGDDFKPLDADDSVIEHDRQARQGLVQAFTTLFLIPEGLSIASPVPDGDSHAAQHLLAGFSARCVIGLAQIPKPCLISNPIRQFHWLITWPNERAKFGMNAGWSGLG